MRTIKDLTNEEKRALVGEIINKDQTGNEWSEIVSMFNLDMHEDTLRKAGVGVHLAVDSMAHDTDENAYKERQKLRDLTGKVNAMYRQESRSELLREAVHEAVMKLKPYPRRTSVDLDDNEESEGYELVLCIGDTHFGADIDCRGLYGETLNRYNEDVFIDRMNKLYNHTIKMLRTNDIDKLTVYMVGDLIDGILRQSQLTRLEYGLVDQVIRFSEYMAGWLDDLSNYARIRLLGVSGNHSEIRPLGSKAREFEEENLEKLIYWYIDSRLSRNERVEVDRDCDRIKIDTVQGYKFLLLHGDGDKKIEELARSAVNLYGERVDFFVCGHLHRGSEFPAGVTPDGNSEIIRVPSVCGMDLYAKNKGYGGRAGAVALVIGKQEGCCCKYPIKL